MLHNAVLYGEEKLYRYDADNDVDVWKGIHITFIICINTVGIILLRKKL